MRSLRYAHPAGAVAAAEHPGDGFWDRTHWVALAMIAVLAVRIHELIPGLALIRPALLVSFGGIILVVKRTDRRHLNEALRSPQAKVVLAFFVWAALSVVTSMWKLLAVESLQALLTSILMFIAIVLCRPTPRVLDRLLVGWVAALGFFAAFGQVMGVVNRGRLRFSGMYDSNDIAALLAMGFPIALGLSMRLRGRDRIIAIVSTFLIVATTVGTGSRGGVVGFMAGAIAFMIASRGARKGIVMGVLVATVALAWGLATPVFRNRVLSLTNLETDYNTTSEVGRKAIWQRGWQYTLERPVLGVGIGNFPIAEGGYFTDQDRRNKWSNAHNSYIQASSETGIPGALLLISSILVALASAWRVRSRGILSGRELIYLPELFGALVAFSVTGYFLSHAYFSPLYALLGVVGLAARVQYLSFIVPVPARGARMQQPVPAPYVARPGERGGLVNARARIGPPQPSR
jgi:O-antigen ligase